MLKIMGLRFVDIQRPSNLEGCFGKLDIEKEKTHPRIGNEAGVSWILQTSLTETKS